MRLGIDFGTTRTVVAAVDDGRHPVVSFEQGDGGGYAEYLPATAVRVGGALRFGWEAMAVLAGGPPPEGAARSIKRAVSRLNPEERVPGLGVSALELVSGYLRHVHDTLRRSSNLRWSPGDDELEAVVAVPANASSRQRYLTLEAFQGAGFNVRGLLDEPSAGAITFGHCSPEALGERSPKRYVLVYDLGGGTFDTSAVTLRGRHFEVLATEGIGRLGGDDFDAALLRLALRGRRALAARVDDGPVLRERLLDRCRAAKERMTPHTKRVHVDLGDLDELDLGGRPELTVDVADLHRETKPLVDATLGCVERVLASLRQGGLDVDDPRTLGALYLVGGAVAFPPVLRKLRERYARKVRLASQPFAATAVGLALAADPDLDIYVRTTPTRYFGVWREGDSGREKIFDALLRKGTAAGNGAATVVRREYRPVHRVGRLRFLECTRLDEAGQPAGDLTPWAEVLFPYDPTLTDREPSTLAGEVGHRAPELGGEHIIETYAYDPDGRIEVTLENATRGYRRAYRL
jgi:molecular chaperone DnaK (HSP70)